MKVEPWIRVKRLQIRSLQYFLSNFLILEPPSSHCIPDNYTDFPTSLNDINIEPKTVLKLLESLDLNKGAGPDHIVPIFIVRCAKNLAEPLTILFRRSITEGVVPNLWKSAFITPVHKNGSKNDVLNYRPISKLCIFAKIFERLVYSQVYSALSPIFIQEQHGFLKNRSTATNLIAFAEYTSANMDDGGQVDAVYTDYSKAFDRIDHQLLLKKLFYAGIHGNLFRWFSSYISNRLQAVVVNGFTSAWIEVPSGVPQGSLLGPLLFVIFINDISPCFRNSNFILYADDMKIYKRIIDLSDCELLQDDLHRFEEYCYNNKLDLNVSKCYSITFTRKINITNFNYLIKNTPLKSVTEIRDLGVIQDSKLIYDRHIDHIFKKANKALGFIMRTCSVFSSIKLIKILYCSFVRSILEYCSQIWNPQYEIYTSRIESIQSRFLKYLQFKCKQTDENYVARCVRHHMLPLYERRRIADVAFLLKIAQSRIDSPLLLKQLRIRVPSRSLRQPLTLATPNSHTNYRLNSFFIRAPSALNNLTDFPELDIFNSNPISVKRKLTKHWFCMHSEK